MAPRPRKRSRRAAPIRPRRAAAPRDVRKAVSGRLIIVGGHEDKEDDSLILREVTSCANGGAVVVCTVASNERDAVWEDYRKVFGRLGCRDVRHLDIGERSEIVKDPPLELLDDASVVFFTGGEQMNITTRFAGTRLCAAVEELYRRGGTVAGTSAGASVMADTMLVAGRGSETHRIRDSLSMAPGLGLLKDVLIDQHFAERGRIGRLLGAVAQNPRLLGIGIDENTAVVVEREERFSVIGEGAVYVADSRAVSYTNVADEETDRTLSIFDVTLHVLSQGDTFDLTTRRPDRGAAEEVESHLLSLVPDGKGRNNNGRKAGARNGDGRARGARH